MLQILIVATNIVHHMAGSNVHVSSNIHVNKVEPELRMMKCPQRLTKVSTRFKLFGYYRTTTNVTVFVTSIF